MDNNNDDNITSSSLPPTPLKEYDDDINDEYMIGGEGDSSSSVSVNGGGGGLVMRRNYLNKLGLFGYTGSTGPSTSTSNNNNKHGIKEAPGNQQETYIQYGGKTRNNTIEEFRLNFGNIPERSADDFRMQYLKKLSYTGVWVPQAQKPPQHQTVIIFDWDDTLLCTSYLNLRAGQSNRQDNILSKTVQKHLSNISATDGKLLEMAMAHGETFIITNAMKGWVEYSARKYVPELLPTLKKVRIISARTDHERQYPGDYHQWKISAFLSVRQALNSQVITNLISLGDSNIEMDAIHVMGSEFSQALIKTIKFRENPSPDELAKQLELVYQKFDKILVNARNLKISLERKWIPSPKSRSPSSSSSPRSSNNNNIEG